MTKPIVTSGQEWTFDLIDQIMPHIEDIAINNYGLDCYPNQIDVISSEQMLDAYSSVGLPIYYNHWSFGKSFIQQHQQYSRGQMGLAYEIVINSSPCISYLMEENSMLMQTLVLAHAAMGHNFFFKNNYLFKQWTDAESIVDYLKFAKKYIADCEERYGEEEVELVLDAAHALKLYGVDRYKRPPKLSAAEEIKLQRERNEQIQYNLNDLWRTIPKTNHDESVEKDSYPKEPQENILYFIEKNAPRLEPWKREIIRIVRKVAQYFYPQIQTKVMNEGCATYHHYHIMHDMHDRGLVDSSAMLEFYQSHSGVLFQPGFDDPRFSGINPYTLGFAMMEDIRRIALDPTDEDRAWFGNQDWVGCGDSVGPIIEACQNFKDESFIKQYLSPKVIRDLKFFSIGHYGESNDYIVGAIHNQNGYRIVRDNLSQQYNLSNMLPDLQITDVDVWGDRSMELTYTEVQEKQLDLKEARATLNYLTYLWGYDVRLMGRNNYGGTYTILN